MNRDTLLGFLGPMGSTLAACFEMMEIAESEIAKAKELHPEHEDELDDSFKLLQPEAGMFERTNTDLYRQHCRELLERVASGAKRTELQLGTKAEVLRLMSEWSLENPPGQQASTLMSKLFADLFPGKLDDVELVDNDPWPAASDEMLLDLRRKIARRTTRAEKQD